MFSYLFSIYLITGIGVLLCTKDNTDPDAPKQRYRYTLDSMSDLFGPLYGSLLLAALFLVIVTALIVFWPVTLYWHYSDKDDDDEDPPQGGKRCRIN